jgi:uncharacterized protein (TIGR00375 family)
MQFVSDLHLHSKYSRAVSQSMILPTMAEWGRKKGIDILATGDWTHPAWFAHLKEYLVEHRPGIYRLRPTFDLPSPTTEFMLVTEVSQIYKKGEKTRRVHNLVFSPSLETCEKVNVELTHRHFNLKADGRPILGIDSEDLYKLLKEIDEHIIMIPAHAWTPWYAVFGSKSGFDTLQECFGDMTQYVYAIETGLSSDPAMNWELSSLDSVVMISNSDAHSPQKLGREANVFELDHEPTYAEFVRILKEQDTKKFSHTIKFFPEEGKYHLDGCAACKFSCTSSESKQLGLRCPHCKRPLTLGVLHRVEALADRKAQIVQSRKIPYKSIVPLPEIIAECFGVKSTSSKKVEEEYVRLTQEVANEFTLLLETSIEEIKIHARAPNLGEAIRRMRAGELVIEPGYDGIYGKVRMFGMDDPSISQQSILF